MYDVLFSHVFFNFLPSSRTTVMEYHLRRHLLHHRISACGKSWSEVLPVRKSSHSSKTQACRTTSGWREKVELFGLLVGAAAGPAGGTFVVEEDDEDDAARRCCSCALSGRRPNPKGTPFDGGERCCSCCSKCSFGKR